MLNSVGFRKSVEELMRYLSDRRPKVAGALEALHITTAQAHQMPALSAASREDLFALSNAALSSMTPEELVRFAQIVDTALFKCYLLVRPGLLAPLCRVGNWCEVSEVEEVLMAREVSWFEHIMYLSLLMIRTEIFRAYLSLQWQEDAWEGSELAQTV
jgi:Vam6/Vps39-like protein vacuolar protein sorting-associated protein 39